MARPSAPGERPVHWVGSSKRDLLDLPGASKGRDRERIGSCAIRGTHPKAKPWKGEGPGVFEIVQDNAGDTYRAVYTVRFSDAIYVLHAFQKKSPRGIRTARGDIELIARRLKMARQDYEARHGKDR